MHDPHRMYEIRCPIYGFIKLNEWEREIISQPAFQRLRRIRQLGWTDYVYPGAMHTRFEHSLGVMHTATLLFDAVVEKSRPILSSELTYNDAGFERGRMLVRLAALLHDVGHGPFSHVAETLMPKRAGQQGRYTHENYSAAIIRSLLRDVIENHRLNENYYIKADEVAALLDGSSNARRDIFWRELIDSQMDADRMDYLRRDSHHAGVQYGKFDFQRLLATIRAAPQVDEGGNIRLAVDEGGWHAAESMVLARYFMFTQVYFHKTRVAFDMHLERALKDLLPNGIFPPPMEEHLPDYLAWDDWQVLGRLSNGEGGEHGDRLRQRNHYREIYHTPESPRKEDLTELKGIQDSLGDLVIEEASAEKSWYKTGQPDIPVISDKNQHDVRPLSEYSAVIRNLRPNFQVRLFSLPENSEMAIRRVRENKEKETDHGEN